MIVELNSKLPLEEIVNVLTKELEIAFEPAELGYVGFVDDYPVVVMDKGSYRVVVITGLPVERVVKLGTAIKATGVVKSRKFTLLGFVDEQWKHLSPKAKEKLLKFFRDNNVELQGTRIMEEEVLKCLSKLVTTPGRGEDLQELLKRGRKVLPRLSRLLAGVLKYQVVRKYLEQ